MKVYHRIPMLYRQLFSFVNPLRSLKLLEKNRKIYWTEKAYSIQLNDILFCFTCDVELVPPFLGGGWEDRTAKLTLEGLAAVLDCLRESDIKATFFMEGVFCEKFPDLVGTIFDEGHEIGSHGYAHESYGGIWLPRKTPCPVVLPKGERRQRIRIASDLITRSINKRPLSFRAPFSFLDEDTLSILELEGFILDSSVCCLVYDVPSQPYRPNRFDLRKEGRMKIYEMPIAVSQYAYRRNLYSYCNELLSEVCVKSPRDAVRHMQLAAKLQALEEKPVTVIVFTSHPWEFANMHIAPDIIFGQNRLSSLKEFFAGAKKLGKVKFMTIHNALKTYRNVLE